MRTIPQHIPITTIIRVLPKEGCKEQTLSWFYAIAESASHFRGHLGSEVFETVNRVGQKEILNVFSFATYENLLVWENSEERKKWLEAGKNFFTEKKEKLQLTGLEFWFENKPSTKKPPAWWKMMAITTTIIFILLNTLAPVCHRLFAALHLPALLISLLSVIILVSLMTWLIMPFVTKLFADWLFEKAKV